MYFEAGRIISNRREKFQNLRIWLILVSLIGFLNFLPVPGLLKIFSVIIVVISLGVLTILYIYQVDMEEMKEWKSIIWPSLALLIISSLFWYLINYINDYLSSPLVFPELTPGISHLLLSFLLSFIWGSITIIYPYTLQIKFYRQNLPQEKYSVFSKKIAELQRRINRSLKTEFNNEAQLADQIKAVLGEMNDYERQMAVLLEELGKYAAGMKEVSTEFVPVIIARNLVFILPIVTTIITSYIEKLLF
jgi:hypothetical protein